jgi:predicted metalloprotease with PDZ domain
MEGELLWLDADTLIRKTTNNKKSLNDFEHIFLGKGGNTGPLIVPYTFDELVADLNEVMPYDWATFLHDRIDKINPHADLAGIEQGGYRLVYRDEPTAGEKSIVEVFGRFTGAVDAWFSLGLRANSEGVILDVLWNGPADKARIVPGSKIIGVNGQIFSPELLRAAIRDAKGKTDPIHLILQSDTFLSTADINYHDGERYPALERVEGTPDYLDDITKPLVPTEAEKKHEK